MLIEWGVHVIFSSETKEKKIMSIHMQLRHMMWAGSSKKHNDHEYIVLENLTLKEASKDGSNWK